MVPSQKAIVYARLCLCPVNYFASMLSKHKSPPNIPYALPLCLTILNNIFFLNIPNIES